MTTALIVGASGLVGRELVRLLGESEHYDAVHSLVRRAGSSGASPKVSEHVVDFEQLGSVPPVRHVYIALGTTIDVAGSESAFRRVDHDYVVSVAAAARASGAERLALVSALGADSASRVFYNRVKGETEADLEALSYPQLVIARPSLLLGDREALGQATRRGEVWARRLLGPVSGLIPAKFRPVRARDVAQSLLRAMQIVSARVSVLESRDLHS